MPQNFHFERALFVVGKQGSGKSTLLRSMFRDVRLGFDRQIPDPVTNQNLQEFYDLSNERSLYIRLTSPNEAGESLDSSHSADVRPYNFLKKTRSKIEGRALGRRFNFACPLQPFKTGTQLMPDVVAVCGAFLTEFNPERIRVIFINPNVVAEWVDSFTIIGLTDGLRSLDTRIEICSVDVRNQKDTSGNYTGYNGLLLADFFDFT